MTLIIPAARILERTPCRVRRALCITAIASAIILALGVGLTQIVFNNRKLCGAAPAILQLGVPGSDGTFLRASASVARDDQLALDVIGRMEQMLFGNDKQETQTALMRAVGYSAPEAAPPAPLDSARAGSDAEPLFVFVGHQESWRGYVSSEFFYLFKALRHVYGWRSLSHGGAGWNSWADVRRQAVADFGRAPTVLLFVEDYPTIVRLGDSRAAKLDFEVWLFMDDVHSHSEERRSAKRAAVNACSAVVPTYPHVLDHHFPGTGQTRRIPLPHSASPFFQIPLNVRPHPAVLLSGSTDPKWYPYRAIVHQKVMAGDGRFTYHPHPGYSQVHNPKNSTAVGEAYARLVHAHLAAITDGLWLNYTVGKIFEIPATGALLLLNEEMMPVVAALGFIPFEHYVPYTEANMDTAIDAVLSAQHRSAVDRIRAQGQTLVWSRHTTLHRAAALHEAALQVYWGVDRSPLEGTQRR